MVLLPNALKIRSNHLLLLSISPTTMKKLILFLYLLHFNAVAQIEPYVQEVEEACTVFSSLWNKNLYGPLLFVEPQSRKIYTIKPGESLVEGILPDSVNLGNTSIHWNGTHWAMLILPLPQDKTGRIQLLTHELFHRAQKDLGFEQNNPDCSHLNDKDGRIYLRLELEALKLALEETTRQDFHLQNALYFRQKRHSLYPAKVQNENLLEMNEGLAEFTGIIHSNRTMQDTKTYFRSAIDRFIKSPTYVRSFAYQTIPVYGYLLRQKDVKWNQKLNNDSNLTQIFLDAWGTAVADENVYQGALIREEEEIRAETNRKRALAYKAQLIDQAHVVLPLEKMNISFDPRNIFPLPPYGTVYPTLTVIDNWGKLTVNSEALISEDWKEVRVSLPKYNPQMNLVQGEGWELNLNEDYSLIESDKGTFTISKKSP